MQELLPQEIVDNEEYVLDALDTDASMEWTAEGEETVNMENEDFYNESYIEQYLENDEISSYEEAFMMGYMEQ